ncbi:MAG: hypothetical protein ABJH85_06055 [Paracoccaceae bacterium]
MRALAQDNSYSQVGSDTDGILCRGELASAIGSSGADQVLRRDDDNGDGSLSRAEADRQTTGSNSLQGPLGFIRKLQKR